MRDTRYAPVSAAALAAPPPGRGSGPVGRSAHRRPDEVRTAEQTMISPLLSDPSLSGSALDTPAESHGRHGDPSASGAYGVAGLGYGSGYDRDSGLGAHDSDGFLAVPRTAGDALGSPGGAHGGPSGGHWAPSSHRMGQPTSYPAERPVRSVEDLVGARHSAEPAERSALGSLDGSSLFGTLSGRRG